MMEYNQITKQTINFQKTAFNSWYNAVTMVQDQAAAAVETMVNQTSLVPEDGRQAIKIWVNACQEEGKRFKSYVEDSFSGLEKHLARESKTAPKAIAKRSQTYNPKNDSWTKRDADTGKFIDQKSDGTPFKGVRKEK